MCGVLPRPGGPTGITLPAIRVRASASQARPRLTLRFTTNRTAAATTPSTSAEQRRTFMTRLHDRNTACSHALARSIALARTDPTSVALRTTLLTGLRRARTQLTRDVEIAHLALGMSEEEVGVEHQLMAPYLHVLQGMLELVGTALRRM